MIILAGIIIILSGVFTLMAAIRNWDWYYNTSKAKILTGIIGRTGARIFYGIFGVLFIIGGIYVMFVGF